MVQATLEKFAFNAISAHVNKEKKTMSPRSMDIEMANMK